MAMTNDAFLDQMKKDLEAGFAEDLPAKYSQVKIGIRDVEKLQGESYRGISFRVGDAPIEGNLNMQQAYQAHEAGVLMRAFSVIRRRPACSRWTGCRSLTYDDQQTREGNHCEL